MSNIKYILNFLKIIRIVGFFPFRWDNEEIITNQNTSENSSNRNKLPIKFKNSAILSFFSNSVFLIIGILSIGSFTDSPTHSSENTITFKISYPLFGGILTTFSILIMFHISSNFSKIKKIFKRILKLISLNYPIKISLELKNFIFFVYFIFFLCFTATQLSGIIKYLKFKEYIRLIEFFFFLFIHFIIFIVFLIFRIICNTYSSVIDKYLSIFYYRKFLKSKNPPDLDIIGKKIEFLILKFGQLNEHQDLLNSYFGPLVSYVLIFHISWLIFVPFLFALNFSDRDFSYGSLISNLMRFLWPSVNIYFLIASPYLMMKKVRILLKKIYNTISLRQVLSSQSILSPSETSKISKISRISKISKISNI